MIVCEAVAVSSCLSADSSRISWLTTPSTTRSSRYLKPDGIDDKWVLEGLERLRRAHKHQITRYQVFSLPRIQDDPPEGKITVLIHGGDEIDERWSAYRRELDAWEGVVSRLRD
jgi:hypothetical protein